MASIPTTANFLARYEDAHLTVEFETGQVHLDGKPLRITRREFELLSLLVRYAGRPIDRRALLDMVWGYSCEVRTRTLDVHIRRLRIRLGAYGRQHIETIHGVGYCFQPRHALVRLDTPARPVLAVSGAQPHPAPD